jgi:hypothetical protein
VDFLHRGCEFGFCVVVEALFEGFQDFLAVASPDGHYEGEAEFFLIAAV